MKCFLLSSSAERDTEMLEWAEQRASAFMLEN